MTMTFRSPTGEQMAVDDTHAQDFLDAGWEQLSDGIPLDDLKAARKATVTAIKEAKQVGLATTSFGDVQNDDRSKGVMNGATTMALLSKMAAQPFSITWTMADNSTVMLDADQMIQLGQETGGFVDAVQQHSTALKNQIDAATTEAELDAIDVEAGWP